MKVAKLVTLLCFSMVLAVPFGIVSAVPAHAQDSMQRMLQQRTLKVGWISAPPTAYKDP
jgi:hypothetical protein